MVDVRVDCGQRSMKLPRQGSVNESCNLARCTRIECVKLINFILCMRQVCGWLPGILTFPIACPANEEFESTIKDFTVPNVVDFVLFFPFDCDRVRWGGNSPLTSFPLYAERRSTWKTSCILRAGGKS